jgi:lactoylglutathione lyase
MASHKSEADPEGRARVFGTNITRPRLLHTMLWIRDPDAALRFYVDGLGMKELYRVDAENKRATGRMVGFADDASGAYIELGQKWDADETYTHGTGYGHIAIGVPDVVALVAKLEAMGFETLDPPAVVIPGGPFRAFVKDSDGYAVELIEDKQG